MSLTSQPDTLNLLSNKNYEFGIKRMPSLEFFVQGVTLPGLYTQAVDTPNPLTNIREQGDHVMYEELMIKFLVDEKLINWLALHRWIEGYTFPDNFEQFRQLKAGDPVKGEGLKSDVFVVIHNSVRTATLEFTFRDAFPIRLSSLDLDSAGTYENVIASVSFAYTKFDII